MRGRAERGRNEEHWSARTVVIIVELDTDDGTEVAPMRGLAVPLVMLGAMVTACTAPGSTPSATPGSPAPPTAATTQAAGSTTPGSSAGAVGTLAQACVDFWKTTPLVLHAEMSETVNPVPGIPEERYTTTWDLSGTDIAFVQVHHQGDQITESASIAVGGTAFERGADGAWTSSARRMITPPTGHPGSVRHPRAAVSGAPGSSGLDPVRLP